MIMTQEFKIAAEVVDRVIVGTSTWKDLFRKHDFFYKYKFYLQVIASSGSADLQLKWSGTVESKVRQLIMKLELVPTMMCAHPYIKGFDQVSECHNDDEVRLVATGDIPEEVANRTKLEELPKEEEAAKEQDAAAKQATEGQEGHRTIWTTTFYIGLSIEPRQADAVGPRKLDISYPTTEFTRMVKQWEQYDESSMGIVVRHIKCSQLPQYVFAGDERPAAKKLKRSKSEKASAKLAAAAASAAEANGTEGVPAKKQKSSTEGNGIASAPSGQAQNGSKTAHADGPLLPLQEKTAASEVENFRLATGGSVPVASSTKESDFRPPAASVAQ
jgi:poly(A) polymerase